MTFTGCLNGGMGYTQLNKMTTTADVLLMNWKTYKSHEIEVGQVAEKIAKESCKQACL